MTLIKLPQGHFEPNSYFHDELEAAKNEQNLVIKGESSRATILHFPITLTGWRPHLESVTANYLHMENTAESLVRDVWLNPKPGEIGVYLGLTVAGRNPYRVSWPRMYEKASGSRITCAEFHDVHIIGGGAGWKMENAIYDAEGVGKGEFMGSVHVTGGHTAVSERFAHLIRLGFTTWINHYADYLNEGLWLDRMWRFQPAQPTCLWIAGNLDPARNQKQVIDGDADLFLNVAGPAQ